LFLAAIAAIGLIGFCVMMPETLKLETETTSRRADWRMGWTNRLRRSDDHDRHATLRSDYFVR